MSAPESPSLYVHQRAPVAPVAAPERLEPRRGLPRDASAGGEAAARRAPTGTRIAVAVLVAALAGMLAAAATWAAPWERTGNESIRVAVRLAAASYDLRHHP